MKPPDNIIEVARRCALWSPCAKSKRGAVVFDPSYPDGKVLGRGWNHQPRGFACDGSDACRVACGKLCIHAEDAAIRDVHDDWKCEGVGDLELVHVKVVGEAVVPGGGPSCWQCSRLVVEVGLKGVWLYELAPGLAGGWPGEWRFYRAEEFHRLTLQHERNKLPVFEDRT